MKKKLFITILIQTSKLCNKIIRIYTSAIQTELLVFTPYNVTNDVKSSFKFNKLRLLTKPIYTSIDHIIFYNVCGTSQIVFYMFIKTTGM